MSISAVSTLIAASGGNAALSGLGELLTDSGLPLDFAALLAEQLPTPGQAEPTLLPGEVTPTPLKPGYELQAQLFKQASVVPDSETLPVVEKQATPLLGQGTEERAEDILAALSGSQQPTETFGLAAKTAIAEADGKAKGDDKDEKTLPLSDPIQSDPGLVAQYIAPQIASPVQNRLPDHVDREKQSISERTSKADNPQTATEDRPSLPERASSELPRTTTAPALPPTAQAANIGEPRIIPRSDNANAAILAGDSTPGNTPAFTTALAATSTANTAATSAPPALSPAVHTALSSPNWSQDFGNRIIWLAKNDQQVAQISINPPQLGPVQISISLSGDVATTSFASPHAEVRQAIQDSLPQLREMFSTAGISLGEANVGSQLPSQNREAAFQFANEARTSRETAILSPDSHASSAPSGIPVQRGRGLVDLFA